MNGPICNDVLVTPVCCNKASPRRLIVHMVLTRALLSPAQVGLDERELDIPANAQGSADDKPIAAAPGNLLQTLTGPQFSVALGIGILLAVLANRIATPNLVDSQARTDILGVIASGGLVTNGVYLLASNLPCNVKISAATHKREGLCAVFVRGSLCLRP